jgi:hypothetical protein
VAASWQSSSFYLSLVFAGKRAVISGIFLTRPLQRASAREAEERAIDQRLASLQLCRKQVPKDGACMFRAIAEFVYGSQSLHEQVRAEVMEYMASHADDFQPFVCMHLILVFRGPCYACSM